MRVLVCGSRSWTDTDTIALTLALLPRDTEVIHGAGRGADLLAAQEATILGFTVTAFPANWKLGRRAGPMRNEQMLDTRPDRVIAFWDGVSRGTAHTIDGARRRGIPVDVIRGP